MLILSLIHICVDRMMTKTIKEQILAVRNTGETNIDVYKRQDRTFARSTKVMGDSSRLSISPQDSLEHTILLGPTGSGKSTAMLSLILADIYAGRSVIVLDPKADLVNSILERIPDGRKDDVVVIDPSDPCLLYTSRCV